MKEILTAFSFIFFPTLLMLLFIGNFKRIYMFKFFDSHRHMIDKQFYLRGILVIYTNKGPHCFLGISKLMYADKNNALERSKIYEYSFAIHIFFIRISFRKKWGNK